MPHFQWVRAEGPGVGRGRHFRPQNREANSYWSGGGTWRGSMPPYKSPSTSPGFPCNIWSNDVQPAPLAELYSFQNIKFHWASQSLQITHLPSSSLLELSQNEFFIFDTVSLIILNIYWAPLSICLMDVRMITFCSMDGDIFWFCNFRRLWSLQKCPTKFRGPFKSVSAMYCKTIYLVIIY